MYLMLSVTNSVAYFFFMFVGDFDMAQKLNLDINTFIMKMCMGSINIGKNKEVNILNFL